MTNNLLATNRMCIWQPGKFNSNLQQKQYQKQMHGRDLLYTINSPMRHQIYSPRDQNPVSIVNEVTLNSK